jgi:hypothetical protein
VRPNKAQGLRETVCSSWIRTILASIPNPVATLLARGVPSDRDGCFHLRRISASLAANMQIIDIHPAVQHRNGVGVKLSS